MDNNTDPTFYLNTQLGSAICLMILSPITIISNVLLLLTIFKDPLKCFRTPATYFIVALALVDFTTGLCFEPFYVMYQIKQYTTWSLKLDQPYASLAFFGTLYTYVPVASSYMFVLGLTLSQYIAISFPQRYHSIVTTRKVVAYTVLSCVYFTMFISLYFAGVSTETLYEVGLHLHPTPITVLLILTSFMLLRSFRKLAKTSRQLGESLTDSETPNTRGQAGTTRSNKISEKQFTIVTLLLSGILIVCVLPHVIVQHIWFYTKQETHQEILNVRAGVDIGNVMLFLKVALDAFIYALWLPKYRRSLKIVLGCGDRQMASYAYEMRTIETVT